MKHILFYDKETSEMIAYCNDGIWVFPNAWDMVTSESEIPLTYAEDGNAYYLEELNKN